jgi:hypothetical protein
MIAFGWHCWCIFGLVSYWHDTICSPLIASWERFIGEYQLKIQTTLFKLGGKQFFFADRVME